MQFVKDGPDIPERLLQDHEDGKVVFFCGAGISSPAKLPGFKELVDKLYQSLNEKPNPTQQTAIDERRYDTAIGLLESDIVSDRVQVRNKLAEALSPDLTAEDATTTHKALLTLGRCREDRVKLVTTNYDRLFEEVISSESSSVKCYQAPLLPIPKSRWDGLVYLHGLLPAEPTSDDLNHLVLSSGDFGLAYLTERWASRFVSELFRNYTVCFVGYSIDDPVLRYMTDALAADCLLGESPLEMFAFGSYSNNEEEECAEKWKAKNVTPILYHDNDDNNHAYLHNTLRTWAETYRDGIQGKERIVIESAIAQPLMSTKQDDFVGQLLWALSDPSGLPAKQFAKLNPVPPLEWLEPLSNGRYHHADLNRFGISSNAKENHNEDDSLTFSMLNRPSPYTLAPWMAVADVGFHGSRWDNVMHHLARWLIRHLNDPKLLLWLVNQGGQLHKELAQQIRDRLDDLDKLEREQNTNELDRIRTNSPNAILISPMRSLWELLLTGRVKSWKHNYSFYDWRSRFKHTGLTAISRLELREMLKPQVSLSAPFRWSGEDGESHEPQRIKDLVDWKIVLSTDDVHSRLRDLSGDERWAKVLPKLLPEFSSLLHDALDLMHELGGASDKRDLSHIYQPSIGEHSQNKDFYDWTALIELTRDAWLALAKQSPERAALEAERWQNIPYPLFRRLSFFAATQDNVIPHHQALDWLLDDEHWWLWSVETQRETIRLLVNISPQLDQLMLEELEQAILAGPPRAMFNDDIEPGLWTSIVEREIWLKLKKIDQTSTALGAASRERLNALSDQYPEWKLATDQSDEFPLWVDEGVGQKKFILTPRSRRELIEWLKQYPTYNHREKDDWQQSCRDNFAATACALCALAKEGVWPIGRWYEALQAWLDKKLIKKSWRFMAPVIASAPDEKLQDLANNVGMWMHDVAKSFKKHEDKLHEGPFLSLAERILSLEHQDSGDADDLVTRAINHPIGHVTWALLTWWLKESPEDEQGLPDKFRPIFTELCDTSEDKCRHGRVLLAAHVIALFRIDPEWTKQHLLPLFAWQHTENDARSAWHGFLWSPRLYRPLMGEIKPCFLDTAQHYTDLGKYRGQYASLLTVAALDPRDTFTTTELQRATRTLPSDGLHEVAETLVHALEGAGEQHDEYWTNRIVPYLDSIWPRTSDTSPDIARSLGHLCVAAQKFFSEALSKLRAWLQPLEYPGSLIHDLHGAALCEQFPQKSLDFLYLVINRQQPFPPSDLRACLDQIQDADPTLKNDIKYRELSDYLHQHD